MPLFNPKTLNVALKAFAFAPTEQQQRAATHWAALLRDPFSLKVKETSLEAEFNHYVVQDILGYRSFDSSGAATLSVKQTIGPGEADLALGQFLEAEINDRVYGLFGLSRAEISLLDEGIAGQY